MHDALLCQNIHHGGGDELDVASAAFAIVDGGYGNSTFGFEEFFVNGQDVARDGGCERLALLAKLSEILTDSGFAFGNHFQLFFDERAGFCECRFSLGKCGTELVKFLHDFEFLGFELIEFALVADDLVAKGGVFVVFAGFELLDFEPLNGGFPRSGIQFQAFQAQFSISQRVFGLLDQLSVAGKFVFGADFILWDFFQILGEGSDSAVAVLEDQQGTDFFQHGIGGWTENQGDGWDWRDLARIGKSAAVLVLRQHAKLALSFTRALGIPWNGTVFRNRADGFFLRGIDTGNQSENRENETGPAKEVLHVWDHKKALCGKQARGALEMH
jgi:hypothetical protein